MSINRRRPSRWQHDCSLERLKMTITRATPAITSPWTVTEPTPSPDHGATRAPSGDRRTLDLFSDGFVILANRETRLGTNAVARGVFGNKPNRFGCICNDLVVLPPLLVRYRAKAVAVAVYRLEANRFGGCDDGRVV